MTESDPKGFSSARLSWMTGDVHHNEAEPRLAEEIIRNREGSLVRGGALVVRTGHDVERQPADSFLVTHDPSLSQGWLSHAIRLLSPEDFTRLWDRLKAYLHHRSLYVQDLWASTGPQERVAVRVVTEQAWHSLFARLLCQSAGQEQTQSGSPRALTLVHAPGFRAAPGLLPTSGPAFFVLFPEEKLALLGGSSYGVDLRQALVDIARSLCPPEALPLRAATTLTRSNQAALFVGRTATGKTALASHPERTLLSDHESIWGPQGLVAALRGCYPRVLGFSPDDDPALAEPLGRFGTLLENVGFDFQNRRVDWNDGQLSPNTRALFAPAGGTTEGGHPRHFFLLTRDTTGVLPPLARLTPEQAVFAFLTSAVTSLDETEVHPLGITPTRQASETAGVGVSPAVTANRLLDLLRRHHVCCWLMNTGPCGDPENAGNRVDLSLSRALVERALEGDLDHVRYEKDPVFLFDVPQECPGLEPAVLDPRARASDPGDYEVRANLLAAELLRRFEPFEDDLPEEVRTMVASTALSLETLDVMEQLAMTL